MRVIPLILLTSITAFGVRNASAQLPGGAQSRQLESVEQRLAMDELAAKFTLSNAPSLFPEEDTDIGVLVLGASKDPSGPGPLVTTLVGGRLVGTFPVPITVVPGCLGLEEILALA